MLWLVAADMRCHGRRLKPSLSSREGVATSDRQPPARSSGRAVRRRAYTILIVVLIPVVAAVVSLVLLRSASSIALLREIHEGGVLVGVAILPC